MTRTQKILTGVLVGGILLGVGYLLFFNKGKKQVLSGLKDDGKKLRNPNPKSILFVGDSQTAIKNYATGNAIKWTYPNFLQKPLSDRGIKMDVLAKGGETTAWMLKNLPNKLKDSKFDRIYIQGSGNDGINLVPFEKLKSNINQMIELGQKSGADVFYVVGFDQEKTLDPNKVATTKYVPTKEEMYKRHKIYFDWQKKLGNEFPNADGIVPLFELPKEYVPDGLHTNEKGAKIFAEQILKTI